jgi:hypothetical protein
MTNFDAAWDKLRSPPQPCVFGARDEAIPLFELTPELIDAATLEERDAIIDDLKKWNMLRLPFGQIAIKFPQEKVAEVLGWTCYPEFRHVYLTMAVAGEPLKVDTLNMCKFEPNRLRRPLSEEELQEQIAAGTALPRQVVTPSITSAKVIMEKRGEFVGEFDVNEGEKRNAGTARDYRAMACEALTILIASLAARNVIKDVRHNGQRDIGGNSQPIHIGGNGITYLSRTIVRPPRFEDVEHSSRAGLAKLMLVRGFVRNQVADTTKPQPPDTRVTVAGKGRAGRREQWIAPWRRSGLRSDAPLHRAAVKHMSETLSPRGEITINGEIVRGFAAIWMGPRQAGRGRRRACREPGYAPLPSRAHRYQRAQERRPDFSHFERGLLERHDGFVEFDAVFRCAGADGVDDKALPQMAVMLLDHLSVGVAEIARHHHQRHTGHDGVRSPGVT